MPVLLSGGGIQGRGAGPGSEPVAIGEPGDVADVGEDAGRDHRSDTVQVHQSRTTRHDHSLELGGGLLDLRFDCDQFGELLGRAIGIVLHGIQELEVETVEHWPNLAKFWRRRQPLCVLSTDGRA